MATCSLARYHRPDQPAPDHHHLIPRAFQLFWRPANATGVLWAPTTIPVCPNHHRLIHQDIVRMMRTTGESPAASYRLAFGSMRLSGIRQAAYDALEGFVQVGGSLQALRAAKLYGEQ